MIRVSDNSMNTLVKLINRSPTLSSRLSIHTHKRSSSAVLANCLQVKDTQQRSAGSIIYNYRMK